MSSKRPKPKSLPLYKRLWHRSQTLTWAYTQGGSAAVLAGFNYMSYVVNDPHFTNILSYMKVPNYVYIGIAVMAFVTWLAHGRD